MHLIVTIPAYNEEETIGDVIKSIPKKIQGITKIDVLVWSDGSTDKTVELAKKAGAKYIFANKKNLGLAKTFDLATAKAVKLGADIIVNTDADNQYDQKEIVKLIKPILNNEADVVNGDRQVNLLSHMPWQKKYGNILGSWTIRMLSGVELKDASSGFRAYTKEAIQSFNLFSSHTYTHETIIQAAFENLAISEIPITFRKRIKGNSKLVSNIWLHVKRSGAIILRTILIYKAFKYLVSFGIFLFMLGALICFRFLYFYLNGFGSGHIQSLIISSILIMSGLNTILMGVIADLLSINRMIISKKSL